jgi:hypothetical protein
LIKYALKRTLNQSYLFASHFLCCFVELFENISCSSRHEESQKPIFFSRILKPNSIGDATFYLPELIAATTILSQEQDPGNISSQKQEP